VEPELLVGDLVSIVARVGTGYPEEYLYWELVQVGAPGKGQWSKNLYRCDFALPEVVVFLGWSYRVIGMMDLSHWGLIPGERVRVAMVSRRRSTYRRPFAVLPEDLTPAFLIRPEGASDGA